LAKNSPQVTLLSASDSGTPVPASLNAAIDDVGDTYVIGLIAVVYTNDSYLSREEVSTTLNTGDDFSVVKIESKCRILMK
jgi:hypothetical protein